MPRKNLYSREDVLNAALAITRERGADAVTARALGERLGTSSKPVFGLFSGMGEVREGLIRAADEVYQTAIRQAMSAGRYPPYKASGMAYIRFAREERELFRLLFMRDRSGEERREDGSLDGLIALIARSTGLSEENARRLHLEMWIYVHGIASMTATAYLDFDEETVSDLLSDAYTALTVRWKEKEA